MRNISLVVDKDRKNEINFASNINFLEIDLEKLALPKICKNEENSKMIPSMSSMNFGETNL